VKLLEDFDKSIAESKKLWSQASARSIEIDRIMANYDEILEKERTLTVVTKPSSSKKGKLSRGNSKVVAPVSRENSKNKN
jgi:hypothetical protein